MSQLYISDLHFGHSNVIHFDYRPFADREEMELVMIHLWNGRVQKEVPCEEGLSIWLESEESTTRTPTHFLLK